MTSPDPVPPPSAPRAEIVTTDGMTWLATDVTLQTLTWPELDPLGVVFAAGVEVDEFAADAIPAPRPPPTASAAPSAAHGSQRRPPRPCFASPISVTYSRIRQASVVITVPTASIWRPWRGRHHPGRTMSGAAGENGACQACHQRD